MNRPSRLALMSALAAGFLTSACLSHQLKLEDTIDANRCIVNQLGYTMVKHGLKGNTSSKGLAFSDGLIQGDIDRDGKSDGYVRLAGFPTTIFVTNQGCTRDMGDVEGKLVSLVEPEEGGKGPRSLLTFVSSERCSGLSGQLVLWKPVDNVLSGVPLATCGCPDLTRPDPDRHPLCPSLRMR